MSHIRRSVIIKSSLALTVSAVLSACASDNKNPQHQCLVSEAPQSSEFSVSGLKHLATYASNSPFDSSAAEIVSYDDCTDQLYVVNAQAKTVEVLQPSQTSLSKKTVLDLQLAATAAGINIGAANSVATFEGKIAVAIENADKQQNGIIALYNAHDHQLINTFNAGALPDMVAFSKDGRWIAAANEGEPSGNYAIDPEGSVTLVDLVKGVDKATVTQITFSDFNQGGARHNEVPPTLRISGPNASVAQDLEPEYLAFGDNGKLYVSLQENNALAKIDIATKQVDKLIDLGTKDWSTLQIDASNKDGKVANFATYPMLESYYMPDSIATFSVGGNTYIATANEGDGREYLYDTTQATCEAAGHEWDEEVCVSHLDEVRGAKLNVAEDHPLAEALKDNDQLGRLKFIKPNQTITKEQPVIAFGGRSFSIWSDDGSLVFDSGDQFSQIVALNDQLNLNSTNDSNDSADDRSDDKGVEPEAITVAEINQRHYAFIGLERQGGIMIYDVTEPASAQFIHYSNRRDFTADVCTQMDDGDCANQTWNPQAGDLGPESIEYFTRQGKHFIAVGNEVSGTTSLFELQF